VGLPKASGADLAGGDPRTNADITRHVLSGEHGPRRDIVTLNAAAALLIAGRCRSLVEGLQAARASIDEGRAADALERLVDASNAPEVAA
jgi:anthranilate phosphoribosyltransferase